MVKEVSASSSCDPDGTKVQPPPWQREGIAGLGRLSLDAHQTFTQQLLLNEWLDFSAPGKYDIKISLTTPVETQKGQSLATRTEGHIAFEVQPGDAEQLKRASAAFLHKIFKASVYQDAAESAAALSYIEDPVAVPYLEKALTAGHMVEPIIIAGLERIGNEEAAQVLISALKSQNTELGQLARSALVTIQQKTSDSNLKEKIRRSL